MGFWVGVCTLSEISVALLQWLDVTGLSDPVVIRIGAVL